jgi:hypothetical protein
VLNTRTKVYILNLCCLDFQYLHGIEIKYQTLAPTSGDSTTTSTWITMGSMAGHQASSPSLEGAHLWWFHDHNNLNHNGEHGRPSSFVTIPREACAPHHWGSSFGPSNKKQKKEAQKRVQHVGVQGPYIKSKWSHITITFSKEDIRLKDYPHKDAMVIYCVIKSFIVKGN